MTIKMLEASQITLDLDAPGLPRLRFGPLGTDWATWQHLVEAQQDGPEAAREAWMTVAKIQKAFAPIPGKEEKDDGGRKRKKG